MSNITQKRFERMMADCSLTLVKDGDPVELDEKKNLAISKALRRGRDEDFEKLKEVL